MRHQDLIMAMTAVRNCTFVDNDSANGFGGSAIHRTEGTAAVSNCVLALGAGGTPVYGGFVTSHSVVFGNTGGDSLACGHLSNLFTNPLFCDAPNDDYTLCSDSPCLPGSPANPWGEHVGALGAGCGECGSAVEGTTWGRIKGLYR